MSTVYKYTVHTYVKGLETLTHFLQKTEEYAKENNIPLSDFVDARLYADMRGLNFQVQSASNTAKASIVRITGVEPLPMEDNETTFEELYARITKTIEFIKSVDPKLFEGKDEAEFEMKRGPIDKKFTGESYAYQFGLPNFYFNVNIAYAILRHRGVPLDKMDYLRFFLEV